MAKKEGRKIVLDIIRSGIESVSIKNLMKRHVFFKEGIFKIKDKQFDLSERRVFVVGGGKASGEMAAELEKIIGASGITEGIVNSNKKARTKKIKVIGAGHPIPDNNGIKGAREMLKLKERYNIGENDLVICLISGGGSALMPLPAVSLKDLQKTNELLIKSGADIHEINSVRKHLSKIKGGQLAKHFEPAKIASLILSDVVGDDIDVIASGPTVADRSTFTNAWAVIMKYRLGKKIPKAVFDYLVNAEEETPKELSNASNFIIGSNRIALKAMEEKAKSYGLKAKVITSKLKGEAAEQAKRIAKIVKNQKKNTAIILGGETTVTIEGRCGKGGRNQEYAAASLLELKDFRREFVMASVATDGVDFMEGVSGGIIDDTSFSRTSEEEIRKELETHNSYALMKKIEGIVNIGHTGTNVCDVIIYMIK